MPTVTRWPSYLLANIPTELRQRLSEEAERQDYSVADVVRQALCERYGLDCELQSFVYVPHLDFQATTLLLRLQPKLYEAVKREAKREGLTMRDLILMILSRCYG